MAASKRYFVVLLLTSLFSKSVSRSESEGVYVEILWPRPGHPLKEHMPVVLDVALGEGRAGDLIRDNAPGLYQVPEGSPCMNENLRMKKHSESRCYLFILHFFSAGLNEHRRAWQQRGPQRSIVDQSMQISLLIQLVLTYS